MNNIIGIFSDWSKSLIKSQMHLALPACIWDLFKCEVIDLIFHINCSSPYQNDSVQSCVIKGISKNASLWIGDDMKILNLVVYFAIFTGPVLNWSFGTICYLWISCVSFWNLFVILGRLNFFLKTLAVWIESQKRGTYNASYSYDDR